MAEDAKKAAGAKNFERRTWDVDEAAKKAAERAAKEAAGEEEVIGPDGRKAPAPYRNAPEGMKGPEGSQRAYLQRRTEELDLESRLNTKTIVTDHTPLSQSGGYWCELCQCKLSDSSTYLDHINGKKHQRRMGMTMRIERVGVDAVKEKLEALKQKKAAESDALQMGVEDKYAVEAMAVRKAASSAASGAPNEHDAHHSGKRKHRDGDTGQGTESKRARGEEAAASGSTTEHADAAATNSIHAQTNAAEEDDGIDPEMAAMLGFSSFGGAKKR